MKNRLQQAALELFLLQGYERTTAAQIATRAGVTERTFFRYFPDKKEVLFEGQALLQEALTASIATGPTDLAPLDMLFGAFKSVVPLLEANRSFSKPRQEVIASAPALAEREQAKLAVLADALAVVLMTLGVDDLRATLAARTGMAAFAKATTAWLDDQTLGLGERLDLAFEGLRTLLGRRDQREIAAPTVPPPLVPG